MADKILQLKVILKESCPQIEREVLIPIDKTFADLHYIIQALMEWNNYHIHEFILSEKEYIGDEPPSKLDRRDRTYIEENKVELEKYLQEKGATLEYIYDFGDNWQHEIKVIDILGKEENREYPVCVDGENASPPENVGGISDYKRMIKAFSEKNHPDHEMYKKWLGVEVYDAESFDIDYINDKLKEIN